MAKHSEVAERRATMIEDLRAASLSPANQGGISLSQRELSLRYGLSGSVVFAVLQKLVEEGVLYTIPRVGTFIGRPMADSVQLYLFVSRHKRANNLFVDTIQTGFEDRVAALGGSCLALSLQDAIWHQMQNDLPDLAGGFLYHSFPDLTTESLGQANLPVVTFGELNFDEPDADRVDFDDVDGGMQATRHLLSLGHRHIAFLPLHGLNDEIGTFVWSVNREEGWRRMLESAGQKSQDLVVHPTATSPAHMELQVVNARETSAALIENPQITAVIAANQYAAQGLLEALQLAKVPAERWPAIVCFDETKDANSMVSYLRLPWEKIGAEAAQLLWERKTGRLTGPPQKRLVKMHLIPRLSCRSDWARASGLVHRRIVDTAALSHSDAVRSEASESLAPAG